MKLSNHHVRLSTRGAAKNLRGQSTLGHGVRLRTLLCWFAMAAIGLEALAQSPSVTTPPGRQTYLGRRIAPTMSYLGAGWLIRANRQKEEDCATLLKELRLKPGMVVCDMGCGNGFYTLQMARQVGPQGKVLGVDIQPEMLELLRTRAEQQGITNVQPIRSELHDPKLPVGVVDLILCVDVYHEFSHPEYMLKAMRRSLSPDGVVVLAEYREEDASVPIKPLHKMSKRQVLKELHHNGFKLVREFDGLPWQHLMFFSRDPAKDPSPESADDILIEDFEDDSYGDWQVEGDAFGDTPAGGQLANQQPISGYVGQQLVNTFRGGDAAQGKATSPPFKLDRDYLVFLVGGGHHSGETGVELLVDGESVRRVTGKQLEHLHWHSWDLREFSGEQAQIRIFDQHSGNFGHVNADHFYLSDTPRVGYDTRRIEAYRSNPNYYNEKYRPAYHFTPEMNWMNDPNGLVYFDGEYHLFYQHNPFGKSWGHMSWGHAVSDDLVHWKHLPIALYHEHDVMIFSGCCVVDHNNTSGFGTGAIPPMVAVYTGHSPVKQTQCLAYSNDRGRTWTKYVNNPVLDLDEKNFRDPKVFWHEPTSKWVMVVSLANAKRLQFYGSADLKKWELLSEFGPAGAKQKPNWECPDLFELPIEGRPGETKWVLEVDMGNGAIAGGSGGEYFIGDFDGTAFTCSQPLDQVNWVDYGRDFYAAVSWSNIPATDGRRLWIGWMNNWQTNQLPTDPWRSAMSLPRRLSLRQTTRGLRMVQRPVQELTSLREDSNTLVGNERIYPGKPLDLRRQLQLSKPDGTYEIFAKFRLGDAEEFGIRVCKGDDEYTTIGYDTVKQAMFVDRTESGQDDFHPEFAGRHAGPLPDQDGVVTLHVFVDASSVEVFGNDGYTVITDRIFPDPTSNGFEVYAEGGTVELERLDMWHLRRAMPSNALK